MKLVELPYYKDSSKLFGQIAAEPWSIFLDSGYPYIDSGRYDIFSAFPFKTILTYGDATFINAGENVSCLYEDPFELLKKELADKVTNFSDLPFCGGAMGYFAYDLGRRIEQLPEIAINDINIPDLAIGLYDWAVIVDHHKRRSWQIWQGRDSTMEARWQTLLDLFHRQTDYEQKKTGIDSSLKLDMDKSDYAKAFKKIKEYIREGDCYQVNLTQRFSADFNGEPWTVYQHLRQSNPAPLSCYFNLPEATVLSSSPERFLNIVDNQVETRPIKGTIRRASTVTEDKVLAQTLLESDKDRAENLMIVDLLRNDIGKNCDVGSVAVPKLFALESYASIHHLVSTITGRLKQGKHALDLLRGCFPGGSITGAPKLRAMQIIEELEPYRRGVYCGSLGYIGFDGNMDSNIAIRTLLVCQDKIYYWAGGGIVADSELEQEYKECFTKTGAVFKLFQQ